jgi:hypothetical protein
VPTCHRDCTSQRRSESLDLPSRRSRRVTRELERDGCRRGDLDPRDQVGSIDGRPQAGIDLALVWRVVARDLDPLKAAVAALLED